MIPARFIFEYPERCLQLIEEIEPLARSRSLVGSFSLLVAPSLFLIPYERLKNNHPLREGTREPEVNRALKRVGRQKWSRSEFWDGEPGQSWRFTRIVTSPERTEEWADEEGLHPFDGEAKNHIGRADTERVIRVIRNALAHGNIVYLDGKGYERLGAQVQYLAFLSRYEENEVDRQRAETYRLVAVTEDDFLAFLKQWSAWLQSKGRDARIFEAA